MPLPRKKKREGESDFQHKIRQWTDHVKERPGRFPGGQKQAIAIAAQQAGVSKGDNMIDQGKGDLGVSGSVLSGKPKETTGMTDYLSKFLNAFGDEAGIMMSQPDKAISKAGKPDWIVDHVKTSERSGFMVQGTNLNNGEKFSWHLDAKSVVDPRYDYSNAHMTNKMREKLVAAHKKAGKDAPKMPGALKEASRENMLPAEAHAVKMAGEAKGASVVPATVMHRISMAVRSQMTAIRDREGYRRVGGQVTVDQYNEAKKESLKESQADLDEFRKLAPNNGADGDAIIFNLAWGHAKNMNDPSLHSKFIDQQKARGAGKADKPAAKPKDKPTKEGELAGLEGPFTYSTGRTLYYDAKEGKYYDRGKDMYLSHDDALQAMGTTGKPKEGGKYKAPEIKEGLTGSGAKTFVLQGTTPSGESYSHNFSSRAEAENYAETIPKPKAPEGAIQTGPRGGKYIEGPGGKKQYVGKSMRSTLEALGILSKSEGEEPGDEGVEPAEDEEMAACIKNLMTASDEAAKAAAASAGLGSTASSGMSSGMGIGQGLATPGGTAQQTVGLAQQGAANVLNKVPGAGPDKPAGQQPQKQPGTSGGATGGGVGKSVEKALTSRSLSIPIYLRQPGYDPAGIQRSATMQTSRMYTALAPPVQDSINQVAEEEQQRWSPVYKSCGCGVVHKADRECPRCSCNKSMQPRTDLRTVLK